MSRHQPMLPQKQYGVVLETGVAQKGDWHSPPNTYWLLPDFPASLRAVKYWPIEKPARSCLFQVGLETAGNDHLPRQFLKHDVVAIVLLHPPDQTYKNGLY